ncbi:MAG: membrane protein [Actinomycetota bacterium]|nr:membrane protein [Actinomycetota bacterium]
MRAPPSLYGGFWPRLTFLIFGLFLCAVGIVLFFESELGLPPWDVLHQGVAEQLEISFGIANLVVSVLVLALAWRLQAHIGLGTLLNALLIGTFVIALTSLAAVNGLSDESLALRIGLLPLALACFGAGSAFYICASMGAGPRDSLMLVTSRRLGVRIGVARTGIEIAALVAGFALGGTAGVGTLVFALGIGPAVEASFWLLARTPLAASEGTPLAAPSGVFARSASASADADLAPKN